MLTFQDYKIWHRHLGKSPKQHLTITEGSCYFNKGTQLFTFPCQTINQWKHILTGCVLLITYKKGSFELVGEVILISKV